MVVVRSLFLIAALFVAVPPATAASDALSRQGAATAAAAARVAVTVPDLSAELTVDGKPVPGDGPMREVTIPIGSNGRKVVVATTWKPNTYTTMTRSRTVAIEPGARATVDLSVEDPSDRVRVVYVPTPADVADAMVRLARVTPNDIAFEPGCGDARITIAAVKGGARRGVGIDIDAERVADSRAKVKEAGLEDRIEIRLGDALDIKDLSTADVVFLYMGDHFNMLLRPSLWRELKVGARVVSHRFLMGDWPPDETVTITSQEGGDYELHLWRVTEAVKRRFE
jgi:uncharacterized protein (TIGR03000 family)